LGLDNRVDMPGHLPRQEMERRFAAAWVQVVPSRWPEPFGLVAAEGLMRGTPVVASDTGGLSEIVDHGRTGFLVPPGDPQALAGALEHLLVNRQQAEEIGAAGRQVALERYGQTAYVNAILQIYQEILQDQGGDRTS
jgi:glycosyltransferase involved in cell wall biosynthesis